MAIISVAYVCCLRISEQKLSICCQFRLCCLRNISHNTMIWSSCYRETTIPRNVPGLYTSDCSTEFDAQGFARWKILFNEVIFSFPWDENTQTWYNISTRYIFKECKKTSFVHDDVAASSTTHIPAICYVL